MFVGILFLDGSGAVVGGRSTLFVELCTHSTVELLFENRLRLDRLELGLEVLHLVGARIASAAGVVHAVWGVLYLIAITAPIALSTAILLGLAWVFSGVARLGEVARKMLLSLGGAVSQAGMVTVSEFVGSSHDCLID